MTVAGVTMAEPKKQLRPIEDFKDEAGSTSTRVYDLDWFLIYWICKATGMESAELLKPIIRARLEQLYQQHSQKIGRLQEHAREEQRIKEGEEESDQDQPRRKRQK